MGSIAILVVTGTVGVSEIKMGKIWRKRMVVCRAELQRKRKWTL